MKIHDKKQDEKKKGKRRKIYASLKSLRYSIKVSTFNRQYMFLKNEMGYFT